MIFPIQFFKKDIVQGTRKILGAFFLFYGFELGFKLLFVLASATQWSTIFDVYMFAVWDGIGLDLSISAYLTLLLIVLRNLGLIGLILVKGPVELRTKLWDALQRHIFMAIFILHWVVLFADILLYRYWGWRLSAQAFIYLDDWNILLKTLPNSVLWVFVLLLAVVFLSYRYVNNWVGSQLTSINASNSVRYWLLVPVLVIIARGGLGDIPINLGSALKNPSTHIQVSAINGFWNAVYSVASIDNNRDLKHALMPIIVENEVYEHYSHHTSKNRITTNQLKQFWLNHPESLPNVHLIILEGINQHWLERDQSPFPLLLKEKSNFLQFTRCYAVGDRTDKGLASLWSGWPGEPGSGILFSPNRWEGLVGLPNVLKSNGYESEFWYGGDINFANQRPFLMQMGCDQITDYFSLESMIQEQQFLDKNRNDLRKLKWGYSDISVSQIMSNSSNNQTSHLGTSIPLFRTWLTLSTHEPFDVVSGKTTMQANDRIKFQLSMAHLDSAISLYFQSLKKNNEWDNSLIFIVSDHGKIFGLEDIEWSESEFFRIPLWIGGGALNAELRGKNWTSVISQSDIYATLSAMLTKNPTNLSNSWGRIMINFNSFPGAISFKGDNSLYIAQNQEKLGHLLKSSTVQDSMEITRQALQSKIIRKYFRY